MRIVSLEEHFLIPDLTSEISREAIARRGWPAPGSPQAAFMPTEKLIETGAKRIADMDEAGISLQVLSLSGPGADLLDADHGPDWARRCNDKLLSIVASNPDRLAGFAHLPMTAPNHAADELERTVNRGFKGAMVNGMTDGAFLDQNRFEPILTRAELLDVPIYIHPNFPPEEVRTAYYDGLPGVTGTTLSIAGWGWHSEAAIHVLRMVLAGTFDKHPKLKIIIGHMGEGLPAMMDRCDQVFTRQTREYLSRSVSQTILDQVWITTSGFFSEAPFKAAMMAFGPDRILFSVDYPFSSNSTGVQFLNDIVTDTDREKIGHGNADTLLKLT